MRGFRSIDANIHDSALKGVIELARDKIPEGKYIGKRMGMVFDALKEFNELLYTNIELTELRKLREEIIKMQDIGEDSKYVKSDDPIVRNAVTRNRFKHCINKYMKRGYSEEEAVKLAEKEFANNPDYLEY